MSTTTAIVSNRSSGGFRGYTNEQKTLRAKLAQLLKWTRDLKTNAMKQSCKALQNHQDIDSRRQIVDQMHDDLDEYKRKLDREVGRIHDICDALIADQSSKNGNEENLRDEILEALRRSPTYSSLEQHIYDDRRPRIRVKPRERIHPGQNQIPRSPFLSTDTIKRKASQPVALQLLDTTCATGTGKRRPPNDPFKRSRSFTNVEHQETRLGMDYIEEDQNDLAWKPFGPKRSISQTILPSEQSNDEPRPTTTTNDDSSDEEFDVAWQRRAKNKVQQEPPPPPVAEPPGKRTVRFALSSELVEVDDTDEISCEQSKDQNNNDQEQNEIIISVISIDEDENTLPVNESSSQLPTIKPRAESKPIVNNDDDDDDAQIIDDSSSDDDEIIALSDDDSKEFKSRKRTQWTSSEIQISHGNSQSQSQSMHNPYRVGIADPSLRSIFLPPPPAPQPPSSTNSQATSGGKRNQGGGGNRKTSPNKRVSERR